MCCHSCIDSKSKGMNLKRETVRKDITENSSFLPLILLISFHSLFLCTCTHAAALFYIVCSCVLSPLPLSLPSPMAPLPSYPICGFVRDQRRTLVPSFYWRSHALASSAQFQQSMGEGTTSFNSHEV